MLAVVQVSAQPFALPAIMLRGEPLGRMKYHEIAEHLLSCKTCQKAAGRLSHAIEGMVEAHLAMLEEERNAKRNAPRNGGDAP